MTPPLVLALTPFILPHILKNEGLSAVALTLPGDLERGAWRELTAEEEQAILDAAK